MKPEVHIDETVFQKIMHWINKSEHEVSGLGTVKYENGVFTVVDAILLEQENTSTTTDLDPTAIGKAMFELKDSDGDLRFWWHSHVNMPVFWSKTDTDTIEKLGEHGWFLSTVFNKKEEMRSCLYMAKPIKSFCDELPTTIITYVQDEDIEAALESIGVKPKKDKIDEIRALLDLTIDEDLIKEWDEQYEKKVKIKSYTSTFARDPKGRFVSHSYGMWDDDSYLGYSGRRLATEDKKEAFPDWEPKSSKNPKIDSLEDLEDDDFETAALVKASDGEIDWDQFFDEDGNLEDEIQAAIEDIKYMKKEYPNISDEEIVQMYADEIPDIGKLLRYIKIS